MARLLLAFTLLTLLCVSANAQSIRLEAEHYVASHDQGGVAIYVTTCSGASGGRAVEGFDFPGDWIEVVLTVGQNYSFSDKLRSGGNSGEESELQSTIFGASPLGEDQFSTFHTVGMGIG